MKVTNIFQHDRIWTILFFSCIVIVGVVLSGSFLAPQAQSSNHSHVLSVTSSPACNSQLGVIGYSLTTENGYSGGEKPEFSGIVAGNQSLMSQSHELFAKPTLDENSQIKQLQSKPHVTSVDPIYAQSSDPTYLSCNYKLQDNQVDQKLAAIARQALITNGIDSSILDNAGTMEFVSLRHFGGKEYLQVAFVYLPANGPQVSYAVILNKTSENVIFAGQTNWYN